MKRRKRPRRCRHCGAILSPHKQIFERKSLRTKFLLNHITAHTGWGPKQKSLKSMTQKFKLMPVCLLRQFGKKNKKEKYICLHHKTDPIENSRTIQLSISMILL